MISEGTHDATIGAYSVEVATRKNGTKSPVINVTVLVAGQGMARGTLWLDDADSVGVPGDHNFRPCSRDRAYDTLRKIGWKGDRDFKSIVGLKCSAVVEHKGNFANVKHINPPLKSGVTADAMALLWGNDAPAIASDDTPFF